MLLLTQQYVIRPLITNLIGATEPEYQPWPSGAKPDTRYALVDPGGLLTQQYAFEGRVSLYRATWKFAHKTASVACLCAIIPILFHGYSLD
jgi:hypothetical protein